MGAEVGGIIKTPRLPFIIGNQPSLTAYAKDWVLVKKSSLPFFTNPFNREIMKAPCPKKFKLMTIDRLMETDLDDHLDVYKAQKFVEDVIMQLVVVNFPLH